MHRLGLRAMFVISNSARSAASDIMVFALFNEVLAAAAGLSWDAPFAQAVTPAILALVDA